MFHLTQTATAGFSNNHAQASQRAMEAAQQLYQRTYTRGWLNKLWANLTGRSCYLPSLDETETSKTITSRYSIGQQTVPLNQIRGSQGRCHDFDRHFYPLHDHLASRWMRVASAWYLGIALPPIELVQVGAVYFVRDGHHRISVAKAFGQSEIMAEVRVWECGQ